MAALLIVTAFAVPSAPASAQLTAGANNNVINLGVVLVGNDVAYDPVNNVYLSVAAYGPVFGVFVSTSGTAVGSPFGIGSASSASFGHYPRTVYSRDLNGGNGGFLVTWHQADGYLHTVVVAYPTGVISSDRLISDGSQGGTRGNGSTGLAYSSTSHKFLVAWTTQVWGIQGRFLDSSGTPTGSVTQYVDAGGAQEPQLAWNSATDEFGLVHGGFNSVAAWVGFKRIPASGATPPAGTAFGFAGSTFSPSVAVNTTSHHYIVGWSLGPGGAKGTELDENGFKIAGERLLASRLGTPVSFNIAFNPVSGTFLAVSEDPAGTPEVVGTELNSDGSPVNGIGVGLSSGATSGSFVPRVTARTTAGEWNISYSRNLSALANQLVSTGTSGGTGGGGGGGLPTTPCTPTINDTSSSIGGAAYTGALSVTTGAGCDWFAVPKAPWLSASPGTGSGSGSFQWTAQANTTGAARTGTILVATATSSQFLTVYQAAPTPCTIAINDTSATVPGTAYSGALSVSTLSGCDWFAVPQASWLSVSTAGGSGPANFQWTAQPNATGAARSGTILVASAIASVSLTVRQSGTRLGDFNGDSYVDLIWQNRDTGGLAVWKMNGFNLMTGGGDSLSPASVPDTGWKIVAAADMNKDGSTDLIFQYDTGYVGVWLMRGSTRLSGELITPTPIPDIAWRIVGAGDFNADGYADILWQHQDGRVAVWYMRGTTYLSGEVIAEALSDQGWRVVGVADMNRDGNPDLVWHHSTTGQVALWLMNRTTLVDGRLLSDSAPDTNWQIRALGDYDNDGDVDVLWQNDATGALAAWVMNGIAVQYGMSLNMSVSDTNWKIVAPR